MYLKDGAVFFHGIIFARPRMVCWSDKWGERRKRRWKIGEAGHATHTQ